MKLLALDLSSSTGWAVLTSGESPECIKLLTYGTIALSKPVIEHGDYPWRLLVAAGDVARRVMDVVKEHTPDLIVIEETNLGKSRTTQKFLEFLHCTLLLQLQMWGQLPKLCYVSSSEWRRAIGLKMTKDDRRHNAKVRRDRKAGKKRLGRGKLTWKHLAVDRVNQQFGLGLKQKDDDAADAILLGMGFLSGARTEE